VPNFPIVAIQRQLRSQNQVVTILLHCNFVIDLLVFLVKLSHNLVLLIL